jgi:pimeloyl-ACP methyl ester carboxylesterase
MRILKKILKIIGILSLLLVVVFYALFYHMTAPKSDKKVKADFEDLGVTPTITHEKFKDFEYRKVAIVKDTSLPTVVFVHGAIGSVLDFKEYMADRMIMNKANTVVYDRIGYNFKEKYQVQESIAFEVQMLEDIVKDLNPVKTVLVGYSYGGPIVLASKKNYQKVILFAPAVYSKVEPMPAMLNVYKWKLTRWLVPPIWKQASKEKLSHKQDLANFEKTWNDNPNEIISVHGDADWIVPYSNSEYLQEIFPENQFSIVTIPDAGHGLVWTQFSQIQKVLLNEIN